MYEAYINKLTRNSIIEYRILYKYGETLSLSSTHTYIDKWKERKRGENIEKTHVSPISLTICSSTLNLEAKILDFVFLRRGRKERESQSKYYSYLDRLILPQYKIYVCMSVQLPICFAPRRSSNKIKGFLYLLRLYVHLYEYMYVVYV